jgi:hypothetical protein
LPSFQRAYNLADEKRQLEHTVFDTVSKSSPVWQRSLEQNAYTLESNVAGITGEGFGRRPKQQR